MKRYVAGLLVALICMAGFTSVHAHIPNECAEHVYRATERAGLYTDSLERLQGVSAAELPAHAPEIRRAFQLSLDALEAANALVVCATSGERTEEAAIQESCLFRLRLADRTREATDKAALEIEIAGLSPLEQRFRRLLHEQNVEIERERRRRENWERCRAEGAHSSAGQ